MLNKKLILFLSVLAATVTAVCLVIAEEKPYEIQMPLGLDKDQYNVPPNNPITPSKIELGKLLYFEKRLSADVLNFSSSASSVSKGETLIDTVNNILAMKVDMVVMRHPSPGAALFLSRNVRSKIINAGDGTHEQDRKSVV